jgi:hypothetical protein
VPEDARPDEDQDDTAPLLRVVTDSRNKAIR